MKRLFIKFAALALLAMGVTMALASCSGSVSSSALMSAGSKAYQALTLTDDQMSQYVKSAVAQMDSQAQVAQASDPYAKRLARITAGLTQVDGTPLNFKVYKTTDVNAFACPDGSVRVYTGLMDLMTDDEVLGVIGHEVGHVAKHHSKNATKAALINSGARDVLSSVGGTVGALSSSQLGALAETYVNNSYSRTQESEADDYGYDFLRASGKNPWAIAQAFTKMQALEQGGGANASAISKMFSTHPDTASRIKHIEERCRKDGIARPSSTATTTKTSTTKTSTTKKSTTKKSIRR